MDFPRFLFLATALALFALRMRPAGGTIVLHPRMARGKAPSEKLMGIVVSIAVLGSTLYVILSEKYDQSSEKWAFGAVGTILGHWLKK